MPILKRLRTKEEPTVGLSLARAGKQLFNECVYDFDDTDYDQFDFTENDITFEFDYAPINLTEAGMKKLFDYDETEIASLSKLGIPAIQFSNTVDERDVSECCIRFHNKHETIDFSPDLDNDIEIDETKERSAENVVTLSKLTPTFVQKLQVETGKDLGDLLLNHAGAWGKRLLLLVYIRRNQWASGNWKILEDREDLFFIHEDTGSSDEEFTILCSPAKKKKCDVIDE
jgi:hypothetical protein